jgi:hypothetical protein
MGKGLGGVKDARQAGEGRKEVRDRRGGSAGGDVSAIRRPRGSRGYRD